jgi:glyoxylase-like metal-dependent hydrolase (beta-lactamase superfamily II)
MSAATYRFKVGRFECIAVCDGAHEYTAGEYFPYVEPQLLAQALADHGLSAEQIPSPFSGLVVNTGSHRVLIDTGAGPLAPCTGALPANLRAAGIVRESIDTVILSHGHPDHVGGNTDAEGRPVFTNARHVLMQDEWRYWTSSACDTNPLGEGFISYIRKNLLPLQDQVDLIDREMDIVPGIRAIPAPGHTPGQVVLAVASEADELLYTADVSLHPLHLEHPAWCTIFDLDPGQTVATKRRVFDRAAEERALVLAFHFAPFPSLGHVVRRHEGWAWEPAATEVPAPAAAGSRSC